MDDKFDSRYFRQSDLRLEKVVLPIPEPWWSRFYEYAWAAQFTQAGDTVLDAACGISHPLKFFLKDQGAIVYACDLDQRILSPEAIRAEMCNSYGESIATQFPDRYFKEIKYAQADICQLPYDEQIFDKIFCISVLEHLALPNLEKALSEFNRTLKKDGLLILTLDSPTVDPGQLVIIADMLGLKLAGNLDLQCPENAISSNLYGVQLYCFRMVLCKA